MKKKCTQRRKPNVNRLVIGMLLAVIAALLTVIVVVVRDTYWVYGVLCAIAAMLGFSIAMMVTEVRTAEMPLIEVITIPDDDDDDVDEWDDEDVELEEVDESAE